MEEIKQTFETLAQNIENELSRLTHQKQHLDSEIRKLKQEKEGPQKNYSVGRVLLDIGGHHYSTSVQSLTSVPGSYFHQLFSGSIPDDMKTTDGRVFLDRNGKLFRHILNCLREPSKFKLRLRNKQELDELREEARFYGVEHLVFANSLFIPDVQNWLDETKITIKEFSSEHSDSFPVSNVINYSRTYWLSRSGTVTDQWMVFDFAKEAYISKLSVKVDNYECSLKDFYIQYSEGDDAISWVTIKEFQAECGNRNQSEQFFEGFEFRGRYMKIFYKNNWGPGGGDYILITNIKFFGALVE
jgi:hypothetical protein